MSKRPAAAKPWLNPNAVQGPAREKIRESWLQGERVRAKALRSCAVGTFLIELPTPRSLAALALGGFDFVVLDMEHSAIDFSSLESLIQRPLDRTRGATMMALAAVDSCKTRLGTPSQREDGP